MINNDCNDQALPARKAEFFKAVDERMKVLTKHGQARVS